MKDPDGVKVLALKNPGQNRNSKGQPIVKDRYNDAPPGSNSPREVRAAQRNLLACAMEVNEVHYHSSVGEEGLIVLLDSVSDITKDVMEMITPNTAYVTGPPMMGTLDGATNKHQLRAKKDKEYEAYRDKDGHRT